MSLLTLVRHAQASFFADHYDQLSALGEAQAQRLGAYWCQNKRIVDEVYVGPRRRQQQTAALVAATYQQAGLPFPEPIQLAELDEYDLTGILQQLAPQLVQQSSQFASLAQSWKSGDTDRDRERNFQRMFEPLMLHWQSNDLVIEGLESWLKFRERVQRGLRYVMERPGRSRRVVAFTSGGFIGTVMQLVLAAPARMALETSWRIRNGAVSEFVFSDERMTLDTFNCVAHLPEPELITYR